MIIGLSLLAGAFFALTPNRGEGKADTPTHGKAGKAKSQQAPSHTEGEKEHIPTAFDEVNDQTEEWDILHSLGIKLPLVGWWTIAGYKVPTKFMWIMLIVAVLIAVIYVKLARHIASGEPVHGPFWNFFEALLTFVRDEVAKPNIPDHAHGQHNEHAEDHHEAHGAGHHHPAPESAGHPADKYVPFLWTLFLFVLFCNLLGLFPFLGSPTANIYVTGGLALICLLIIHGAPIAKHGLFRSLASLWPKIDLPNFYGIGWLFKNAICLMVFLLEYLGTFIKSGVLAVRLFANMFAGHMVLASILLFIVIAGNSPMWPVVTGASVLGVVALSLLELFIAFLQAYIFVFLTALFMGMGLNPEH
jgi:F-type H+-transporting ATPase subunit a